MFPRDQTPRRKNPNLNSIRFGQILSVEADRNQMQLEFSDGSGIRTVQMTSPSASLNARRRDVPEVGSMAMVAFKGSTSINPIVIKYLSVNEYNSLVNGGMVEDAAPSSLVTEGTTPQEVLPYRMLMSGEQEDVSSGYGYTYRSVRGFSEMGSGMLRYFLDRDNYESGINTPEHQIQLLDFDKVAMSDYFKLGTVSRLDDKGFKKYIEQDGNFAKELYLNLKWKGTPNNLLTVQKGHVYDTDGKIINQAETGKALRSKEHYYTKSNLITSFEIDENGNYVVKLAKDVDKGVIWDLTGGDANWTVRIGKDELVNIQGKAEKYVEKDYIIDVGANLNETVAGNATHDVSGSYTLSVGGDANIVAGGNLILSAAMVIIN